MDLLLLPSALLQGRHIDWLERENPEAQVWHNLELLRKPSVVLQLVLTCTIDVAASGYLSINAGLLPPGHAGGNKHSTKTFFVLVAGSLSFVGIFHHPNLGRMLVATIGPEQSPPAIRKKESG